MQGMADRGVAMPLNNGYGVVIGTVNLHTIEPPDEEGNWPHYQIYVDTPQGVYECVINLKSRTDIKIEEKDLKDACTTCFADILAKPDGFHPLPPNPYSGALDVIRHKGLQGEHACSNSNSWFCRILPWLCKERCETHNCAKWWKENGTDVIQLLEYYLTRASRIYVFGEPYSDGRLGMHNIHMNQGDPLDTPFAAENGVWQDGGIILEYHDPQPRLSVFITKFESQSLHTDSLGRPA